MLISHQYKFLFYHVPKTGGTSIEKALHRITEKDTYATLHTSFEQSKKLYGKYFDYYKFAFVRNPWSLLFSWFTAINRAQQHVITKDNFESFIPKISNIPLVAENQFSYIRDGNNLAMDYIGRFETLEQEFSGLVETLGLPKYKLSHENGSNQGRYDYRDFYSKESIEFVKEYYAIDVNTFGYIF